MGTTVTAEQIQENTAGGKTGRMANLELLRCIAMMMVIVLHYLGKGGLLGDTAAGSLTVTQTAAWVLEAFCIVAVNVYMLISGYFLSTSSFKLSRLLALWLQVWFYSVAVGLLGVATGWLPAEEFDTHYLLTLLFPITMEHYWFMSAYFFLYLFVPFMGMAVRHMTKRQLQIAIGCLLLVFCVWKSVLPVRLEMDQKGYDCIWYLCVFLAAAYIRKFGLAFFQKRWQWICLYLGACILIFAESMCLYQIYLRTGSLALIRNIALEYNHIFPFLAAVGLFMTFLMTEVSGALAGIAKRISPYTLGVYLLHENMGVRYAWQNWFGANKISGVMELLVFTLIAAVIIFASGILADWIRTRIMGGIHGLFLECGLYRRMVEKIESLDRLCKGEEQK